MNIFPVILCGGSGTRLWPLSRESTPKQFLPQLIGDGSLFKQTIKRCMFSYSEPLIITNNSYRFMVKQHLQEIGIDEARILIEPSQKNTGPAILSAAVDLVDRGKDGLMLVVPSDHYIPNESAFQKTILSAAKAIEKGQIVCFGISPSYPETGYGYIKIDGYGDTLTRVLQFIEKPNKKVAASFLKEGGYFWNSGIFLFHPSDLLGLAQKIEPEMLKYTRQATEAKTKDLDFYRLDENSWDKLNAKSFDYAFMEIAKNIACVAFNDQWSDVGNWASVLKSKDHDKQGNFISKNSKAVDCKNVALWSYNKDQILAGIGLENLIVVSTADAILVADSSQCQNVTLLVDKLKKDSISQATEHNYEYRPWGWFKNVAETPSYKIKILHVLPGKKLSLQYHQFRSENWVVTKGRATVIVDGVERDLETTESIFVKIGAHHQLINNTNETVEVVETQTGSYFGEDDITRITDDYNRV